MNVVIALPVLLPLLAAGLSLALHRWSAAQRTLSLSVLTASFVASVVLLVEVQRDGTVAADAGGWPAPIGIRVSTS